MQIIILTGTIGSGKSTVARLLKELGAAIIDSDEVARQVIEPATPAFDEVVEAFGEDILTAEHHIDRRKLAHQVFNHPSALRKLNQIIHPRVDSKVESLFEKYQAAGLKAVFVEMAILPDASWKKRVNQVWLVKVSQAVALRRLEERGMSESESLVRLANQSSMENIVKKDLKIITNNGNLSDLKQQVANLWNKIDNEDGTRIWDD